MIGTGRVKIAGKSLEAILTVLGDIIEKKRFK